MFPKYTPLLPWATCILCCVCLAINSVDVILSIVGIFQTEQSHEAFTWSLQPTLVYFPLKSISFCCCFSHISLLTSHAAHKTVLMPSPTSLQAFWRQDRILFISIFSAEALQRLRFQYLYMFIYVCLLFPHLVPKKICSHSINIGWNN